MISRRLRRPLCALICLLLCISLTLPALAYTGVSNWAKEDVDSADALGIIPDSLKNRKLSTSMTRLEMCHMAVNAFEKLTGSSLYPAKIDHFSDTKDADVCVAFELGIVSGFPDGTFRPTDPITRQEFAKVTGNLLNVLGWSEDAQTLSIFADETKVANWAKSAAADMVRLGIVNGDNKNNLNPGKSVSYEEACALFFRAYQMLETGEDSGSIGAADIVGDEEITFNGLSNWAKETVMQMYSMEMLPDTALQMQMNQPITRGDLCEVAVRIYQSVNGKVPDVSDTSFSDTDLQSVLLAKKLGLVNGYPDGTFRPDGVLTREQMFQITENLLKACGYHEKTDEELLKDAFSDYSSIGGWAKECIAVLYRIEVMRGDNQSRALPQSKTSCEQAIAMFMRTLKQVGKWYQNHPLSKIVGPLTSPNVALQVVDLAKSFVGYPYVWAGADPSVGFDCSGLVYYVYKQLGYNIKRDGDGQASNGIAVKESEMQPGDIIIFANKYTGAIQHVGLYIGDGKMVHAQSSRTGVVISAYDYDTNKYIYTIRRIIY